MAIVNEKMVIKREDELIKTLAKTKNLNLGIEDLRDIQSPELLIEYLKDDPDNVEFEYVIKFYAYARGSSGFHSYEKLVNNLDIKDLDHEITWYPEWHVKERKKYIDNLF